MSRSYSEIGNAVGAFPFAKTHCKGERPTQSAVCTSSPLRSLRPCCTVFLSILRLFCHQRHMEDSIGVLCVNRVFLQLAGSSGVVESWDAVQNCDAAVRPRSAPPSRTSCVVCLVDLVHLVRFVQSNKRNRPNNHPVTLPVARRSLRALARLGEKSIRHCLILKIGLVGG